MKLRLNRWLRESKAVELGVFQELVGSRVGLTAVAANASLHGKDDDGQLRLQLKKVVQRPSQRQSHAAHHPSCLPQALGWLLPAASHAQPMLHYQSDQFGVHLTQDPPLLATARPVQTSVRLPDL